MSKDTTTIPHPTTITPITGKVIHGKKQGKPMGFPTMNIAYKGDEISSGTYKLNTIIEGKIYPSVGVYFADRGIFETHLLDYAGEDNYEKEITIVPLVKIRDNITFDSKDPDIRTKLQQQITKDIAWAKDHVRTVITFGTFDHFHKGHEAYLSKAKWFGDKLVTIIARDTTVKRVKSLTPTHNEEERLSIVKNAGISDTVVLGDKESYYTCLREFQPDVLCFGYDQRSFDEGIRNRYNSSELTQPSTVRIEAFHPEKYKSSLFRK